MKCEVQGLVFSSDQSFEFYCEVSALKRLAPPTLLSGWCRSLLGVWILGGLLRNPPLMQSGQLHDGVTSSHRCVWSSQEKNLRANVPACPVSGFSPANSTSCRSQREREPHSVPYTQSEFPWVPSLLCPPQLHCARQTLDLMAGECRDSH